MALAAFAAWGAPRPAPLVFLGALAIGVLVLGMAMQQAVAVAAGIALLGCEYILSLYVRDVTANVGAAAYGAVLLLVSELAHWSLELGAQFRGDTAVLRRRVQIIAALAAASLVLGVGAAAVAGAPVPGSVLLTALGVGSVLAAIAIVTVLLWERRSGEA